MGQADTWLTDTTFEEDNCAERHQNLRRQIYIGRVHCTLVTNCLSDYRHTRTILSEQLDDEDDSEDDSSETHDVEEVMAVATTDEASSTTERPEHMVVNCAAAEDRAKRKQRL